MTTEPSASEPVKRLGDFVAERDGSGWVVRRVETWWGALAREEWRVEADGLEVRRWLLDLCRTRRYRGATLTLDFSRRSPARARSLVVNAGRDQRVLAEGDLEDLRRLGAFLSEQTGWRLRVEKVSTSRPSRGMFPLAALFLAGGVMVAAIGFWQSRVAVHEVRRLRQIDAADLPAVTPGIPVLASGVIGGLTATEPHGLVLFNYSLSRSRTVHQRGRSPATVSSRKPDFRLVQGHAAIPVTGGSYGLVKPPHHRQSGVAVYEGFRPGDTATVVGTVASRPEGRVLVAVTVFGGPASQLPGFVQRDGRITLAAGLLSIGVGAYLAALARRPRQPLLGAPGRRRM